MQRDLLRAHPAASTDPPHTDGRRQADRCDPDSRFLDPGRAGALLRRLGSAGTAAGSAYDALVAAAAVEHGLPLVSRDRRALSTYRDLGAGVELVP